VDGVGQAVNSMESRGRIVSVTDADGVREAVLDLSAAYPMLKKWERCIRLQKDLVQITDEIESDRAVEITYPLHTLVMPQAQGNGLRISRDVGCMEVTPLDGELTLSEITDRYAIPLNEDVPKEFAVTMPPQYHAYYKTPKKEKHCICVQYRMLK
jgi:hypothetical protein